MVREISGDLVARADLLLVVTADLVDLHFSI
jgi:hypothetical protein